MYEKEIRNFKWKISEELKIVEFKEEFISKDEQECIFNIMMKGYNKEEDPDIMVDCSYQKYITKLKNSELFSLTNILVSTIYKDEKLGGLILEVRGTMPINGITIRNRTVRLTNEQRQRKSDFMKKIRKPK